PELGPRVERAVLVVLPGDAGHRLLEGRLVDAVLLGVGRGEQAEGGRRGEAGARAVLGRADRGQARDAGVLELLHPDGHRHVVGPAGHRVAGVAEGLRSGGAVVLEPAHRLVGQLQRPREREAALPGEERAEPERVHRVDRDAGRLERVLRGLHEQVADALVPALAEAGAAHADDRHPVPDPVARHVRPPLDDACPRPGTRALYGQDAGPRNARALNTVPRTRWRRWSHGPWAMPKS